MAVTTKLIQLRPIYRQCASGTTSIQFFSSSFNTPDPNENLPNNSTSPPPPPPSPPTPPRPQSQSPFPSYISDVKARLKQQQQENRRSQPPRLPFSYSSSSSTRNKEGLEQIHKNLAEYRRLSNVPPPASPNSPPQSPQQLSLQEFYLRNRSEESSPASSKSYGKVWFDSIKESVRRLRPVTAKTQNVRAGQANDFMSFKESLKLKPGDRSEIGGSNNLPLSIFGKEMKEKGRDSANAATEQEFVRNYSYKDLGQMLRSLRTEKKGDKKDWFSLEELNERLTKLREIEKVEDASKFSGCTLTLKIVF